MWWCRIPNHGNGRTIMAKKEEAEKKIVRRTEGRQLKVNLSKDEIFEAGAKAADAQQKIMELEDELTTFKDQHKGKVAMAEADLSGMRNHLEPHRQDHSSLPA